MAEVAIDAGVFCRRLKSLYEHWEVRLRGVLPAKRSQEDITRFFAAYVLLTYIVCCGVSSYSHRLATAHTTTTSVALAVLAGLAQAKACTLSIDINFSDDVTV